MESENTETTPVEETQETTDTTAPEETQETTATEPPEDGETTQAKEADGAETEESEGDDTESEPAPGDGKHKRKTGSQRNRERLDREREAWAQERAFYQAQLAQRTAQQPGAEAPKLTPEQQLQEYLGSMVQQGVQHALTQREQAQAEQQLEQKWQEQLPADEDEAHEVRNFIGRARTGLRPGPIKEALLTSEYAPKIIASLIRNPRELARLSALPEGQAAREIGRLEAQFAAGEAPVKPKSAARPPAPPTNVAGKPSAPRSLDDSMPFAEWKRALRSKGR